MFLNESELRYMGELRQDCTHEDIARSRPCAQAAALPPCAACAPQALPPRVSHLNQSIMYKYPDACTTRAALAAAAHRFVPG